MKPEKFRNKWVGVSCTLELVWTVAC